MELKTDDAKVITRALYRELVEKVMEREKKAAEVAIHMDMLFHTLADEEVDVKAVTEHANTALRLQINALMRLEHEIFGDEKEAKDEPEVPETKAEETPKEEPKNNEEKKDG